LRNILEVLGISRQAPLGDDQLCLQTLHSRCLGCPSGPFA
jgi:hypothetical protein